MKYKLLNEEGYYRDKTTLESKNLLQLNITSIPTGFNLNWDDFSTIEEVLAFYNIERIPGLNTNEITKTTIVVDNSIIGKLKL